ncbi:hypothetical protein MGYG_08583 [Nannizzia gypsea CBS 118893]|uniref:Uncharacterized protein n=1 Tax=Arthroderma gypseum (strain ATCC MYA-4604 / CBS 118893) TaxID=535722 RepID=E4V6E4_ARTGP|nr:hypothetical protein MGYG_08583 [Nannizzia gypsea CBS 118893]EFQ96660.1 hypothetical protein MGYG_08583 [Nannizzia gypsea CBS 118893]
MADLNKNIPEPVDSPLLIGLPDRTPQVKYTNMEDISFLVDRRVRLCCLDDSQSPFIIVVNIPPTILQDFDTIYPDKGPRILANLQDKVLVIEVMVTKAHEIAARMLEMCIERQLEKMNLEYEILASGAGRATSSTFVKEPDGSFTLQHHDWPILAIESGVYESETKLKMDARGWLESASSETKIVITIKIDRHSPQIDFKKWEHSISTPNRTTRSSHQPAEVTEAIHARYYNDVTDITGDMTIQFEKIAGRKPNNANEHDIVITKSDFESISKMVWLGQKFL